MNYMPPVAHYKIHAIMSKVVKVVFVATSFTLNFLIY